MTYSNGDLGISFVVSLVIKNPGCEMCALPHLLGNIAGNGAKEHHCQPFIIITIDEWEEGLKQKSP